MKKWLVAGSLVVSMSCINPSYAVDPVTTGVAAGAAAKIAAEGTAVAAGAAAAGAAGAGVATALASPVIGVAGGVGTAYYMNEELFKNCETNQEACDKAKIGTYTGAGLGTLGSLGAVGLAGANTAGLATIGGAIGGGVITGTAMVVAAPIVAAAAVGGLAYWWYTDSNGGEAPADPVNNTDVPTTPAPAESPATN